MQSNYVYIIFETLVITDNHAVLMNICRLPLDCGPQFRNLYMVYSYCSYNFFYKRYAVLHDCTFNHQLLGVTYKIYAILSIDLE